MYRGTSLCLLLFCSSGICSAALSSSTVATIRTELRGLFNEDAEIFGGFLRLSFHDCVGGRCDGCINMGQEDNAVLADYIKVLEELLTLNSLIGVISRADLWALAGMEAVIYATELDRLGSVANPCVPSLLFKWGRIDCPTAPSTTTVSTFPSAFGNTAQTLNFLATEFGLDSRESTAVMGAHTFGRAKAKFKGQWGARIDRFSNTYYKDLQDASLGWTQVNVGEPEDQLWQWNSSRVPATLMLNADMSLVKDFPESTSGRVSCAFSTCAASTTTAHVAAFAADNCLWIQEFSAAFTKIITHGYASLNDVTP